jgi:hypothetical protein|tara:strand:+ start:33 stop:740 length:708 start_codon:yes stop_codon:yes gene_type:complete
VFVAKRALLTKITIKIKKPLLHKLNLSLSIITLFFSIQYSTAQGFYSEVGLGLGNVVVEKHSVGKAELYFNVLKSYKLGEIWRNWIRSFYWRRFHSGGREIIEGDTETLSPNDAQFNSAAIFYRLPIKRKIYLETRLGYSSLSYYIHADDKRKISESNISYGLGIGITRFENISLSFRYQHFGNTSACEGTKDSRVIISNSKPLKLVLFRAAYRFSWNTTIRDRWNQIRNGIRKK